VKSHIPEQIRALFNQEDKYKIGLRLYAVYQVSLGQPTRKLEELYNTSFKQITNWVHRFEAEGVEGLRDRRGRGRKPNLSQDQREELSRLIAESSPTDHGYNSDTWTGPLVTELVARRFGTTYKKAQIYNILKALGFSYQKSKGFYPEADPEKHEVFKEGLKKNP
jgi:transposase